MTRIFSSAEQLATNFNTTVIIGGLLILVVVIGFTISARAAPFSMSFKARGIIGLVLFLGVLWYAYSTTYEQFVGLTLDSAEFRLLYAGPFSREISVPRASVTAIRFGAASGRGSSTCRIGIEVQGSEKYFSAWIPDRNNDCRKIRDEIMRELNQ